MNRAIKMEWLNKTAELVREGHDAATIRKELQSYLSYEIDSPVNLKNTRTILLNTWVYTPVEYHRLRDLALPLVENGGTEALAAHWSMLLVAYPVFADVCGLIGKLTSIQDTFTTTWLRDRLFDIWGERGTLVYSSGRVVQTLRNLGVVETVATGVHRVVKREMNSRNSTEALLMALLLLKEKAYYHVADLTSLPKLFPFKVHISPEWLHNSNNLTWDNMGGEMLLTTE